MSHSTGVVRLEDGRIYYCEYNGTVDVMRSPIYTTYDEMQADWRGSKWITCTNKEHKHLPARIATSYGYGFSWDGEVCLDCMCITDGYTPYDEVKEENRNETKGLPDWFPNREAYKL